MPDRGATLLTTEGGAWPTPENATVTPAGAETAFASTTVPISTTATLRALCTRDGWADSRVATHSYLYLDDVLAQPANPGVSRPCGAASPRASGPPTTRWTPTW